MRGFSAIHEAQPLRPLKDPLIVGKFYCNEAFFPHERHLNSKRVVVAITATTLVFGYWLMQSVERRTSELVAAILRIAKGEADLSERLEESPTELGRIVASFNQVMNRIQKAGTLCGERTTSLAEKGMEVSESAARITQQIQKSQSQSAAVQSESVSVKKSIESASQTIDSVSGSLQNASTRIAQLAAEMDNAKK